MEDGRPATVSGKLIVKLRQLYTAPDVARN
jgi:hypothetical protein